MPVSEREWEDVPRATGTRQEVLPHAPDDGRSEAGEDQAAEPGGRGGYPWSDCQGRAGSGGWKDRLQTGVNIGILPATGVGECGKGESRRICCRRFTLIGADQESEDRDIGKTRILPRMNAD